MEPYDFSLLYQPTKKERLSGIPQNTPEWLSARRGRITASKRAHMILNSRDKTLNTMMDQMAIDLKHPADESFGSAATDHGHAFEEQAIDEYDMMRLTDGAIVKSPGMFVHSEFDIASATPDFFEGDDTTGQIKCPFLLKNHLALLHFGCRQTNAGYYTQVQFESFVTQRSRIVFVSYHPDAPATNQLYIEEVPLDGWLQSMFLSKLTKINDMLVNGLRFDVKKSYETIDSIPDLF